MPGESLVYGHTVEAVFKRGLQGQLTPRLRTRLKGLGVDVDAIQRMYSQATFEGAVIAAAEEVFAGDGLATGMRKLGERAVEGYDETVIGKLMLGALRLLGPHRTLERATLNLRSSNNYTDCVVKRDGPNRYELSIANVGRLAEFNQGVVIAALRMAGAPQVRVTVIRREGLNCVYRVEWD